MIFFYKSSTTFLKFFLKFKRERYTGKVAVWIELFVEKRIHPDIKPRIAILKKNLEQLEFLMNSYLKNDHEQLAQLLVEEEKSLSDISEQKALQAKLVTTQG